MFETGLRRNAGTTAKVRIIIIMMIIILLWISLPIMYVWLSLLFKCNIKKQITRYKLYTTHGTCYRCVYCIIIYAQNIKIEHVN